MQLLDLLYNWWWLFLSYWIGDNESIDNQGRSNWNDGTNHSGTNRSSQRI